MTAERPPAYVVVRVGSALADEDVVGTKRAGLACLSDGRIRWGDVDAGGTMGQREIVQDALEDAGVAVVPLGDYSGGGRSVLRLRATVKAADFRLCARHWIGGDAKALSGDVRLAVEWRVERRDADGLERSHTSEVARTVDARHAASLGALYRGLLRAAAGDLAAWLAPAVAR